MIKEELFIEAKKTFAEKYGQPHTIASFAPGRVEIIGNHTDYNEGFVVSSAINYGIFFLLAPNGLDHSRVFCGRTQEHATFQMANLDLGLDGGGWAKYIYGSIVELLKGSDGVLPEIDAMILGDIPLGSGLSSSAALEVATAFAVAKLGNISKTNLEFAKIAQAAEHTYAGVMCGLLDQLSSIYGKENQLIMTDFRSIEVENLPLGDDASFIVCNTKVKHALVDGEYNERRESCEKAAEFFKEKLGDRISTLRDVTSAELEQYAGEMDPIAAKRAAHVIGECERVLAGKKYLDEGKIEKFGQLMYESHDSSINNFENSCPELDFVVEASKSIPGVMGARLSGGGFGGSAVLLVHPRNAQTIGKALANAYENEMGTDCEIYYVKAFSGATVL
ncbi:MAG: galactokinase [Kiritimatiellae bacterium]|jgi:galactokinase|nr:galactokinase [Kiritimatiellia bacterium]